MAFCQAGMSSSVGAGGVLDDNPVRRFFRHVIQERLRRLFPRESQVLDLECGSGEDAVFLASQGVVVHAIDPSRERIERARALAAGLGIPDGSLRFERRTAEELVGLASEAAFDGAYSSLGALRDVDLAAVGRGLAALLRPGAPILLGLTLRGVAEAGCGAGGGGRPTPRAVREALGSAFGWTDAFGLGILVPGPAQSAWVTRWPQLFGLLAAVEGLIRHWPGVRDTGHAFVLQGVRVAGVPNR